MVPDWCQISELNCWGEEIFSDLKLPYLMAAAAVVEENPSTAVSNVTSRSVKSRRLQKCGVIVVEVKNVQTLESIGS